MTIWCLDHRSASAQPTADSTVASSQVNGTDTAKTNGVVTTTDEPTTAATGTSMPPPSAASVPAATESPAPQAPPPPRPVHKPTSIFDTRLRAPGKGKLFRFAMLKVQLLIRHRYYISFAMECQHIYPSRHQGRPSLSSEHPCF